MSTRQFIDTTRNRYNISASSGTFQTTSLSWTTVVSISNFAVSGRRLKFYFVSDGSGNNSYIQISTLTSNLPEYRILATSTVIAWSKLTFQREAPAYFNFSWAATPGTYTFYLQVRNLVATGGADTIDVRYLKMLISEQ